MQTPQTFDAPRKRAPSRRALATRARVFDAAERVFAQRGFDGATIRDIAAEAGEPVGTIHHHGGGKDVLFHRVVARRAEPLAQARLDALATARQDGGLTVHGLLAAFMRPLLDLSRDDAGWRDYARLVAFVSADDRWRAISAACFDPTARVFLDDLVPLLPHASRREVAEGFIFSVSAMLALMTTQGRMEALGGPADPGHDPVAHLIRHCAAALRG